MPNNKPQSRGENTGRVFNLDLLNTYRTLLQTTDLQKAYQEFVEMFRYLRIRLEQEMPAFRFQGGISENAMDYAYFSFTHPALKEQGLKLTVVFVHRSFQLELWLSGVNRPQQCRWAERLQCLPPMQLSADPAHTDYLVRLPIQADVSHGDEVVAAVETGIECMRDFLAAQGISGW